MGRMRSAVVAAAVGALIVAGASPAAAAEVEPFAVTSTGLTMGQDFSSNVVFRPTWTEGATIAKVEIYVNGSLRGTILNWSNGLRTRVLPAEDNTDITVTVKVYDTAGNAADATTVVHADLIAPTMTLNPAPHTPVGGTIIWTATEAPDDVAEVAVVDSNNKKLAATTAAPWTVTWNSVGGASRVQVVVTDRAGNKRSYQDWTPDNTPPVIEAEFNAHTMRFPRVAGLSVTFFDRSQVNRNEWWVDGKLVKSVHRPETYYNVNGMVHDFGPASRTATVEVRAWDRAGNLTSRTFKLVIDVDGPKVTWVAPANGTLVRGSRISSTIRATDPAGIFDALLNNQPAAGGPGLPATIKAGTDGRKTLTWRVLDSLHNETIVTRTVIVDNTRPVLKITKAPKSGAKVGGTVKVAAAASDRNGVNRVELLINGKVVARDVKAGYAFTINTRKYGKKIRFQLRAYDRANNVTTTTTRTWHR